MNEDAAARFIADEAEIPDWRWLTGRGTDLETAYRRATERHPELLARLREAKAVLDDSASLRRG
jgi:hypothetical protein